MSSPKKGQDGDTEGTSPAPQAKKDGRGQKRRGQNRDNQGNQGDKRKKAGKGRKRGKSDFDFFGDLRDLQTHELTDMLSDHKASLRSLERQHESLKSERQSLISTVQVLRGALSSSTGMSRERRALLKQLRDRTPLINSERSRRDSINQCISPTSDLLEILLKRTYNDLTVIRDDPSRAPDLTRETQKFSFLFELIEMWRQKEVSDAAHKRYIDLMREQRETVKRLDELRDESGQVEEETASSTPRLEAGKISRKEEKGLNDRISTMLDQIREQRKEINWLRREIGRVDSFSRIREKDEQHGRTVRKRIGSLQQHAASGGSLSLEDMARLLSAGGLSAIQSEGSEKSEAPKKSRDRGRKRRGGSRSAARGAARGTARAYKRRED
jgi:uncharacterized coiled-coil DUF342 family protein